MINILKTKLFLEETSRLGHIKNISNYNNLYKYFIRDDELVNRINSVIEKKTILNNAYGEYLNIFNDK